MRYNIIAQLKKNSGIVSVVRKIRNINNDILRFTNLRILKYLSPSSKYFGPPKYELFTWEDIENYVAQRQRWENKPIIRKLYDQEITMPAPLLTMGIPEPGAEIYPKKKCSSQEYVCMFPKARLYLKDFSLITNDDHFIQPLSNYYGHRLHTHVLYHKIKLSKTQRLSGKTLFLRGGNTYYHIMHDSLCSFKLIQDAGIDINAIDQFLICDYHDNWYESAFAKLDLPKNKFIRGDATGAFECDQLFITTYFEHHGSWYSDYLKSLFIPKSLQHEPGDKIFVSRAKTTKRRFINEDEVVSFLRQRGFSVVFSEDLSIEEQVAIYKQARYIVSAHGANLVNIIFCEPGTKVCEIRYTKHSNYHKKTYYEMAINSRLDYYLLYCSKGRLPLEGGEAESDVYVNIQDLETILQAMGC